MSKSGKFIGAIGCMSIVTFCAVFAKSNPEFVMTACAVSYLIGVIYGAGSSGEAK